MNSKLQTLVFGSLIAGSVMFSAVPVMAWDWPWHNRDQQRSDNRPDRQVDHRADRHEQDNRSNHGGSASDYEQWQQARQKALYDASHHASRKQIAEDDAVADEIENRMRHNR